MDTGEVADRLEIHELLARYATALDAGPIELLDTVFTPDAELDYTSAGGIAGPAREVVPWLGQVMALFEVRQHFVTNTAVTFGPDRAEAAAVSYLDNPMGLRVASGELHVFRIGGRYHDRLARTPDGWRITARREEQLWRVGDLPG